MNQTFLQRYKYFGLRFLYWRFPTFFSSFFNRVKDLTSPQLVSRYISNQCIDIFNGEIGHGVDVHQRDFPGLGILHYSLIRIIKPKRVLCIGSFRGYIPALCALACKDNLHGQVDFVDAGYDEKNAASWGGDGLWKKIDTKKYFSKHGLSNITTHVMSDVVFAKKYSQRRYQYIYIDGDHRYEGVKKDYQLFWNKLDSGGLMVFHDILGEGYYGKVKFGVKKFWNELPQKYKISLHFPKESGLGILQKP